MFSSMYALLNYINVNLDKSCECNNCTTLNNFLNETIEKLERLKSEITVTRMPLAEFFNNLFNYNK